MCVNRAEYYSCGTLQPAPQEVLSRISVLWYIEAGDNAESDSIFMKIARSKVEHFYLNLTRIVNSSG
jgi:hypothetical protein